MEGSLYFTLEHLSCKATYLLRLSAIKDNDGYNW